MGESAGVSVAAMRRGGVVKQKPVDLETTYNLWSLCFENIFDVYWRSFSSIRITAPACLLLPRSSGFGTARQLTLLLYITCMRSAMGPTWEFIKVFARSRRGSAPGPSRPLLFHKGELALRASEEFLEEAASAPRNAVQFGNLLK